MKTLIKNGRVVTAIDDYHADIFIGGETVTTIGKTLDVQADVVIDASGKLVIPGGIDPHTHMELPFGGTSRCRWQARSRSCVVAVRAPQYPLAARVAVRIGYQLHSRIAYCVGECVTVQREPGPNRQRYDHLKRLATNVTRFDLSERMKTALMIRLDRA